MSTPFPQAAASYPLDGRREAGADVLAHPLRVPAPARARLRRGLRGRHQPVGAAPGVARPAAGAGSARRRGRGARTRAADLPAPADAVPLRRLGPGLPYRRLDRPRPLAVRAARLRERVRARGPVDPLHVLHPCRPDVLRLRLGDPPPWEGVPSPFPARPRARPPRPLPPPLAGLTRGDGAAALADLPRDVRGGPHQAPRRPLLARPHLHGLPLRDAAQPQPALLVPPPGPRLVPRRRDRVQPRGGARGAAVR